MDSVGPQTILVERILEQLGTDKPREMLLRLGRSADVSREIASLSTL
ncbi:MAG: hypothetical protein WBN23_05860 [Woeseia sp.]